MFPPAQNFDIDARAVSGITGSISIACWIIVFTPQILVNFRRSSASGLSIHFLIVWLLGDVFNVLGAVLQGVLPTMIILAVYYTLADIVLLGQCLYYWYRDARQHLYDHDQEAWLVGTQEEEEDDDGDDHNVHHIPAAAHLSPATPLLDPQLKLDSDSDSEEDSVTLSLRGKPSPRRSIWYTILTNTLAVLMVCLAGVLGWYLTPAPSAPSSPAPPPQFSLLGQLFGYLCAVLYLASRIPQIYLNYRRKTVEGLSLLFFLFACLGNLTYVVSIVAYVPDGEKEDSGWGEEQRREYWRHIAVNASWLVGSAGTLGLDLLIFAQFFWYRDPLEDYLPITPAGSSSESSSVHTESDVEDHDDAEGSLAPTTTGDRRRSTRRRYL